ncbi:TetR family transcriptional regulator [Iodidimonas sp. SYSU 1G8]|uniref:TetR/AcrR family transcriptional regulator n=1 Tax=Iodidimonas sp. SYSU 1G8 TaxID=3133967 RepID=UPI0031FE86EC
MARTASAAKADPKEELIAAADEILAEQGAAAATVRAITARAGVNMAAVNYHFGSRDGLFIAICGRHMHEANARVLQNLQSLEDRHSPPSVAEIFHPLVETAFQIWVNDKVLRALRSMVFFSPETAERLNVSQMSEVYNRMRAALIRACPHLSAQQIRQRFGFAIGAIMNHVHNQDAHLQWNHDDVSMEELVAFIAAGFRA